MGLITKHSLISYNDTVPLADKLQCDILSLINSLFVQSPSVIFDIPSLPISFLAMFNSLKAVPIMIKSTSRHYKHLAIAL